MNLNEAIKVLDKIVPDPGTGLPDEVFYYVSRTTPLINVDLLIQDEAGRTLLAWRDDVYAGTGWHIPGGIIRFQETFASRLKQVALSEIGTELVYDPAPLAINELIHRERRDRSHFISILYRCFLPMKFTIQDQVKRDGDVGYLAWHSACPADLIHYHEIYRSYIDAPSSVIKALS